MTSEPFANLEQALERVEEAARELLEQVSESRVEALPSEAVRDLFRYLRPLWEEATTASRWDAETLSHKTQLLKGVYIGLRAGIRATPDLTGIPPLGAEGEVILTCEQRCWLEYIPQYQQCYETVLRTTGDARKAKDICEYLGHMLVLYPCIERCFVQVF